MAVVDLLIGKKSFQLSCDDGDEPRLKRLAGVVNQRLNDLSDHAPGSGDTTMLAMLALMLQDELTEAKEKAPEHPAEAIPNALPRDHERVVVEALDTVSEFVEHLASRINAR